MFLTSSVTNMEFVRKCVYEYFLAVEDIPLTGCEVSEIFRHSMCKLLGLNSQSSTELVGEVADIVISRLRPLVSRYNLSADIEYRQGVLEACVHTMEMSRKKAGL